MKATEQYFPVVLFIMLYKVVLTFDSKRVTIQVRGGMLYCGSLLNYSTTGSWQVIRCALN